MDEKRQTVLFYIPTLNAGGAEKQCAFVASGLKRQFGYDCRVILDYSDRVKETNRAALDAAGVPIVGLPSGGWAAFRALRKIFRENRDATVFSYLAHPNFFGSLAARLAGLRRYYAGVRCGKMPQKKFLFERFANRHLACKTIFNSFRARDLFVSRGFAAARTMVITNAIEMWPEPLRSEEKGPLRVVTVGRFVPEKDYHTWLATIARLRQKNVAVSARIVGWGPEAERVKGWIAEFGLTDVVTLLPGDSNVREVLADAELYLSTSVSEGVSNSIMEAMNAGLPVVATDVGDNNRLIENGRSGWLTAVGAADELSERIRDLAENGKRRLAFGLRAREILRQRHAPELILEAYRKLVEAK